MEIYKDQMEKLTGIFDVLESEYEDLKIWSNLGSALEDLKISMKIWRDSLMILGKLRAKWESFLYRERSIKSGFSRVSKWIAEGSLYRARIWKGMAFWNPKWLLKFKAHREATNERCVRFFLRVLRDPKN
jgi:hypothetical protein